VLRAEGLAFVEKLQHAQVSVSHLHLPDCTHGFISTGRYSPATRKRLNEVAAMLKKYAATI
jgi:acetyl esterase